MKFTLEIELGTDAIANRGDLERAIMRTASELSHTISQSFSSIPDESEHVLGEQNCIVGKWGVSTEKRSYWRQSEDGQSSEFVEETL